MKTFTAKSSGQSRVGGGRSVVPQPVVCHQRAAVRQILHGPHLQPKLTVGPPGDAYEREADRVADEVMRMPEPGAVASSVPPRVQRVCAECEEEVQRQPVPGEDEEEKKLQRKAASGQMPEVTPDLESRITALRGSGQPLPSTERAFFEPRFGQDFSSVRMHSGPEAADLAQRVQARAFTLGHSVVLGKGEERPGTADGRRLLAHELTHVVQQSGATANIARQAEEPAAQTAAPASIQPAQEFPDADKYSPGAEPDTKEDFGGDAEVAKFAAALAACWIAHPKALAGKLKRIKRPDANTPEAFLAVLADHYKQAMRGLRSKGTPDVLRKAWMVAAAEEVKFYNTGWTPFGSHWPHFKTAPAYARNTSEIPTKWKGKDSLKIAPGLAGFLSKLGEQYPKFYATNYTGHTTGSDSNQGLSVDIMGLPMDDKKRWFQPAEAVKFLKTVAALASSKDYAGTQWYAIYNDFSVASEINKFTGKTRVGFRGDTSQYHGPAPAILHIHLELVVPADVAVPAPEPPKPEAVTGAVAAP